MRTYIFKSLILFLALSMTSCVSKKKFTKMLTDKEMQNLALEEALKQLEDCQKKGGNFQTDLRGKDSEIQQKNAQLEINKNRIADLEEQLKVARKNNDNLLERMSDLSIVSKTGAESIQKSLESINQQNEYIQELTQNIRAKDSTNLVLVMNLKRSLNDVNDEDIDIDVRGAVVMISISDKMLFQSGSSRIGSRATTVLGKVAKIVKDHSDLQIIVEGHTDDRPIKNSCTEDNWDLSAQRATAVVRTLQKNYGVSPSRMSASGRSSYVPKADNASDGGRSLNRRTEIILTPKLDEYFKLLEPPLKN